MREARKHDGELDEFVADDVASIHLERMDDGHWWLGVTHQDGAETHINLSTKRGAAVAAYAHIYGEPVPLTPPETPTEGQ